MIVRACLFLIGLFCVSSSYCTKKETLRFEVSALMQKYGAVGVSVAVVKDNKIVYSGSFGYKDKQHSIELRKNDLFRIASISKTFVATAIMQLVEKKKLSLDDDINNYLDFKVCHPKYPEIPITIKMLLCHRSSITDAQGWIKTSFDNINPNKNTHYHLCYGNYEPGETFTYCNLNYELLGAILENVSNMRFDVYVDEYIIKPLGIKGGFNIDNLDSSLFVNSYQNNVQLDSLILNEKTYQKKLDRFPHYVLGYNTSVFSPASGMVISVEDLSRYMIMHMNDGRRSKSKIQIINEASEREIRKIQTEKTQYALSFMHYNWIIKDEDLIGQTGGLYGIHTAMIFHPKKKYGFVIFCNGCKSKLADGHDMNFDILRVLYNIYIK